MQQSFKNIGFFTRVTGGLRSFLSRLIGKKKKPVEKGNETPYSEIDKLRRKLNVIPAYEETIVHFMYNQVKKMKAQQQLDCFVMMEMKLTSKGYKETKTHYAFRGNQINPDGCVVQLTTVRAVKRFPRGEIFDFIFLANQDGWMCSGHAEELIDNFVKTVFERYTKFSKVQEIKNMISYEYTMPFGNNPPRIKIEYPDPTNKEPAGVAPILIIDFIKTPHVG